MKIPLNMYLFYIIDIYISSNFWSVVNFLVYGNLAKIGIEINVGFTVGQVSVAPISENPKRWKTTGREQNAEWYLLQLLSCRTDLKIKKQKLKFWKVGLFLRSIFFGNKIGVNPTFLSVSE